jgi:TP901 family phage tail tape measure protein
MQDLKMGETLDDGVSLGKISGQLKAIGINVLDATGNLRQMGTVIEELGDKWGTLTRAQQVATAEVLAGKRQYTQLFALMENMDKYKENLNTAENSEGTLEKQAARWEQGWEAASNKVRASVEGIYNSLINDKALIEMTRGFATLLEGVQKFIENLGGIKGVLMTIGSIFTSVFSN